MKMNQDELYYVQMTDFKETVIENWQKLRNEDEYCDVTLVCDGGKKIKAHKFILASVSAVFQNMLANENPQQKMLLFLRGVTYSQLICLLDFFYKGEVNIDPKQLDKFLAVAKDLQVKGISEVGDIKEEKIEEIKTSNVLIKSNSIDCCEPQEELPFDVTRISEDVKEEQNINDKNSLISYEEIKKEDSSSQYCNQCSYKTSVRSHLRQHIRSIHEGVRYPCNTCDHSSKSINGLNEHVNNVHKGIKYKCPQCDLQTGNKHYLPKHIGKFHDKTVYTCSQCHKSVIGNYKFNKHMKSMHRELQNE